MDKFLDHLLTDKKPTPQFTRTQVQKVSSFISDIVTMAKNKNLLRTAKKDKVSAFIYSILKEKTDYENSVYISKFLK